ncbi:hypothetical protein DBA20_11870 [Pandoraea capi]|nr:hypothetical protein [Pandoraea sp. LA3]MDN4583678.1 hypothetical protein [Pandoraea capi]
MADASPRTRHSAAIQRMADASTDRDGDKFGAMLPLQRAADTSAGPESPPEGGLPGGLKSSIELLSGFTMDDVTVHANSTKPAQLQAHAFTQDTQIHLAPGQEKHLAHEAWHVVQQKQGRVQPNAQTRNGTALNDDAGLEREADIMGERALQLRGRAGAPGSLQSARATPTVQRVNISGHQYSVEQAIAAVLDELGTPAPRIDARFRPLIAQPEILREVVEDIDQRYTEKSLDGEDHFFEILEDTFETWYEWTARNRRPPPGLEVTVDPLDLPHETPLPVRQEHARQIRLQIEGINSLSVEQWLGNVLLNRMKSTDTQISSKFATDTGKRVAQTIDGYLLKDDELALFFMNTVLRRLEDIVSKHKEYAGNAAVQGIIRAAQTAIAVGKNVYLIFRNMNGQMYLDWLAKNGLEGGVGRNSGEGDNTWFRAKFADGIHLASANGGALERNAVLHNPDQCIGGPMAILWHGREEEAVATLQENFRRFRDEYARLASACHTQRQSVAQKRYDVENRGAYLAKVNDSNRFSALFRMPASAPKSPDTLAQELQDATLTLGTLEGQLTEISARYRQSATEYRSAILRHLGNYDVNSNLGQAWMEGRDATSRIEQVLGNVLEYVQRFGIDNVRNVRMNVRYDLASPVFGSGHLPAQPDVGAEDFVKASREAGQVSVPELSRFKREKLDTPPDPSSKQQTLHDLGHRHSDVFTAQQAMDASLQNVRHHFGVGRAPGRGMNCLIYAVLLASGRNPTQQQVDHIRASAMDLGLVGLLDMFDLNQGGGQAVLQMIVNQIGAFTLHVVSVNPVTGGFSSYETYNLGGGPVLTILHTGNHFTPLFGDPTAFQAALDPGVPRIPHTL